MKFKSSLLLLSLLSTSVYAKTFNLDTVVNNNNISIIVTKMVETFKKGTVDSKYPIMISGNYDLDDHNRLIGITVNHASFKVDNIPLIGSYTTDVSVSATFDKGNCNNIVTSSSAVNSGTPGFVNPIFTSDLSRRKNDAINIFINNSDLKNYCVHSDTESYQVIFY